MTITKPDLGSSGWGSVLNAALDTLDARPGVTPLTTAQRDALLPADLWDGRVILNTSLDRLQRYDLANTTWVLIADFSEIAALLATTGTPAMPAKTASRGVSTSAARSDHVHPVPVWQTYSPTWIGTTTNPVLGNGTLTGRYVRNGDTVQGNIALTIGSTTTLGAGRWDFTLPFTTQDSGTLAPLGQVIGYDGTRKWRADLINHGVASRAYPWRDNGASETTFTPTTPFTWAAGHYILIRFNYETNAA